MLIVIICTDNNQLSVNIEEIRVFHIYLINDDLFLRHIVPLTPVSFCSGLFYYTSSSSYRTLPLTVSLSGFYMKSGILI